LLRAGEPEPFRAVVVFGAVLEIIQGGGILGVCEGLTEDDGDIFSVERRDC
jgi:hypothetical protein